MIRQRRGIEKLTLETKNVILEGLVAYAAASYARRIEEKQPCTSNYTWRVRMAIGPPRLRIFLQSPLASHHKPMRLSGVPQAVWTRRAINENRPRSH